MLKSQFWWKIVQNFPESHSDQCPILLLHFDKWKYEKHFSHFVSSHWQKWSSIHAFLNDCCDFSKTIWNKSFCILYTVRLFQAFFSTGCLFYFEGFGCKTTKMTHRHCWRQSLNFIVSQVEKWDKNTAKKIQTNIRKYEVSVSERRSQTSGGNATEGSHGNIHCKKYWFYLYKRTVTVRPWTSTWSSEVLDLNQPKSTTRLCCTGKKRADVFRPTQFLHVGGAVFQPHSASFISGSVSGPGLGGSSSRSLELPVLAALAILVSVCSYGDGR